MENNNSLKQTSSLPATVPVSGKLSSAFSNKIANFFYRLGIAVANRPWTTIVVSLIFVAISGIGFIRFHTERDPLKLWIPQNSKFLVDTEWLVGSFKEGVRMEHVMFTAPNVLHPDVMQRLLNISQAVMNLETTISDGEHGRKKISWTDVCLKIPIISQVTKHGTAAFDQTRKRRRRADDPFADDFFTADNDLFGNTTAKETELRPKGGALDLKSDLFTNLYCGIINAFPVGCYQQNILEIWDFNATIIHNLTVEEILHAVNTVHMSATTGHTMNFSLLLGDIRRNDEGAITGAGSLLSQWYVHVNFSEVDQEKHGNIAGTENWASEKTLNWEYRYLEVMKDLVGVLSTKYFAIYYSAERSFGDISAATMFADMDKLIIGIILMFVYMQVVLSKFSWVELRLLLGSMGLFSVGMAFVCACGICSLLGVKYGPVHTSLPFLLMGLGVDDMFVMMACWRKVSLKDVDIPERIGLMLSHAGASITVTSVTDIAAFLIGSITILPSLQSFCIYATVGIIMTYVFAITFFVAIFTIDEYRIKEQRNSVLPFIKHRNTSVHYERNLMTRGINFFYQKFVFTKAGKTLVILFTVCASSWNVLNTLKLEQKFDPVWFLPTSSYLFKYIDNRRTMFPEMGFEAGVFFGPMNYTQEFPKILQLTDDMSNLTEYLHEVNSWANRLQDFSMQSLELNLTAANVTDHQFQMVLSKFLYSAQGGKYQANFRFQRKLACGTEAPPITIAGIPFKFRKFSHRNEYLPAMRAMEGLMAKSNFSTAERTPAAIMWSKIFGNWITDEIIDQELMRNIGLAMICVMACTVLLIMNLNVCFWIFVCVVLTLVNVCGLMFRWGLTIDMVSCIALQLAVGLCVDYAAHIGHTFLVTPNGTRTERALEAMLHIGAAVLYGGGSTLLGLAMLSMSDAYTFKSFFKIFFLVIMFGLFHGLVFLPVILSFVGPPPFKTILQGKLSTTPGDKPMIHPTTDDRVAATEFNRTEKSKMAKAGEEDVVTLAAVEMAEANENSDTN